MDEIELYKKLGALTKSKEHWKDNISDVALLLTNHSSKITGKALWMLGEMGLIYSEEIQPYVEKIAAFLECDDSFLRERALNAIGRIGRGNPELIKCHWNKIFELANDICPDVRLSFIWASENIATTAPELFEQSISVFNKLLEDENRRVRMEAPEMFRVLGKRKPEYVRLSLDKLFYLSENDEEPVVRIHAKGAIKAIEHN